tara:strand:+ start:133 stop:396 length:264 start_codon:yes stop_codon:yes gene_type:complete
MTISGVVTTEVEIIKQTIQARDAASVLSLALGTMHPSANAAISISVFLHQNPLLQAHSFSTGHTTKNLLQFEAGRCCEHRVPPYGMN